MHEVVRATTDLYDKRISALTDLFHQTQLTFVEFRQSITQSVEYMKGRIDGGISPTMQKVKEQNEELAKSILRLENEMVKMVGELSEKVAVMDEHYAAPISDWKDFQRNLRGFVFNVAAVAVVPTIGALITMWVWFSHLRAEIPMLAASLQHVPR